MDRRSYGSTASTSTRASTSTVPQPSTSSTRRADATQPGPISPPRFSSGRTSRRQRLHRPSLLSLSDQSAPLSPRRHGPASASGSVSGSSLGSPYTQTLRHRQSRHGDGENSDGNWASLRDMVSRDQDEEEEEEEGNNHSDTSTLRPTRRSTEPITAQAGSMSSVTSIRSFFTARSSIRSERSGNNTHRSGESPSAGLLSSSPPQMNGFGNMEEIMESDRDIQPPDGSITTLGDDVSKDRDDETRPLLHGANKSLPTKQGQLSLYGIESADIQSHGGRAGHHIL